MKKAMIKGEYKRVAMWSSSPDVLEMAHATPCSIVEARSLVARLWEVHGGGCVMPAVFFRDRSRGYANYRLRRTTLPSSPMTPGGKRRGHLRVGIVLHELAHIIGHDKGCKGHDRDFVSCLDTLATEWRRMVTEPHHHTTTGRGPAP